MAEFHVGVVLQGPITSLAESAAHCEEAGADSLWVGEYFQAALVRAAVVLGATRRVRVGTHVLQAFARSPLATALAAGELHQFGGGRFLLGLGSQLPEANRRWHAFGTERPVADLREYIAAVRALLSAGAHEPVDLPGPRWPLRVPGFRETAGERVPIGVGCAQLGSIRLAVQVGDAVLGHLLWTPGFASTVCQQLEDVGRSTVPVSVARIVAPSSVPGARVDAAMMLSHYAVTGAYAPLIEAAGINLPRNHLVRALRSGATTGIEELAGPLLEKFCVEDPAALARHRRELSLVGVSELVLVPPARRTDADVTERYEHATAELIASSAPC